MAINMNGLHLSQKAGPDEDDVCRWKVLDQKALWFW